MAKHISEEGESFEYKIEFVTPYHRLQGKTVTTKAYPSLSAARGAVERETEGYGEILAVHKRRVFRHDWFVTDER